MKVVAHKGLYGTGKKLGTELLLYSISHGDVHNVINLLDEEEADVNSYNINKQTPLHVSSNKVSMLCTLKTKRLCLSF